MLEKDIYMYVKNKRGRKSTERLYVEKGVLNLMQLNDKPLCFKSNERNPLRVEIFSS